MDEWLKYWDENNHKFSWFILKYFPEYWIQLEALRKTKNKKMMYYILSDIWFKLPDNRFNIIENPPGWREFLTLLEW